MENDQIGKWPKRKMTKMDDDHNRKRPKWKTTKMEDDQITSFSIVLTY